MSNYTKSDKNRTCHFGVNFYPNALEFVNNPITKTQTWNVYQKQWPTFDAWAQKKKKENYTFKMLSESQSRHHVTFLRSCDQYRHTLNLRFFFLAFSCKSSSFQTSFTFRFVVKSNKTREINIKQNSLFWWRAADRAEKEQFWRFLRTPLAFTVLSL